MDNIFTCPICKATTSERPALSRRDNKTEICPTCGTLEALDTVRWTEETKQAITRHIEKLKASRKS